jgi:hypothetical protein
MFQEIHPTEGRDMNPPATQPQSASQSATLDPVTLEVMIRGTMDSLPHHPAASAAEQAAGRHAAYTIFASLRPRDVQEAMLAARYTAAHFHSIDDLRRAAQHDMPEELVLRHRRSAVTLARMVEAAERGLIRRQAGPPVKPATLLASIPAQRAQPAPAAAPTPASLAAAAPRAPTPQAAAAPSVPAPQVAPSAPEPQAAPAPVPALQAAAVGQRPVAPVAPRRANGGFAAPTEAEMAQLLADVEARLAVSAKALAA